MARITGSPNNPTVPISSVGAPYSNVVTVGTTSVNLVPPLSDTVEDFYEIGITNASTGGQVLSLNIAGGVAVAGQGVVLQPNSIVTFTAATNYSAPRRGISGICSAAGGSIAVTYR